MKRLLCMFACAALGFTGCSSGPPEVTTEQASGLTSVVGATAGVGATVGASTTSGTIGVIPVCVPPYETPVYTRPATDAIALSSLLEGAAYAQASNSNWQDISSGNFCGGSEKELVLLKNAHSYFSVMRGPTPYVVAASDGVSDPAHPWRAVTAADLDGDGFDEIVAVRHVTASGVPDVVVTKADPKTCYLDPPWLEATIGSPTNSDWIDVAVGNFDGSGKQIALLKSGSPNLTLARPFASTLGRSLATDLEPGTTYAWKGIAAGDLDGDGVDELVAARQVGDGKAATVIAYKWNGKGFTAVASSLFGNDGNSAWAGITVGDFNGDGRASIALVKNAHSFFAVFDWPSGTALRKLTTGDLDAVSGQEWRGVTAVDWLGGDQYAAELVAVRAAQDPYRTDLFVYGDPYHRAQRDSALDGTKAQWDQVAGQSGAQLYQELTDTDTNTMSFAMVADDDYLSLVDFLAATNGKCSGGMQVRTSVTLCPPESQTISGVCAPMKDSPITPWNEIDVYNAGMSAASDPSGGCGYYCGYAAVLGRLAQDYPQLVSMGIDDYMHHPDQLSGENIAEVQSILRTRAPWMSFIPETYYGDLATGGVPDFSRMVDTFIFYFRNEQHGQCLSNPCGEPSVWNAPGEVAYAKTFLPAGRKLQVGTYWDTLWSTPPQTPTTRYDFDLMRLLLEMPGLGGVTAYPMHAPQIACNEIDFLNDSYCTLQKVYGETPRVLTHTDLTAAAGAPVAAGDPDSYVFPAQGVQNVIYRATDSHAHELWRTSTAIGTDDLTALAGAPAVVGDPKAYVFEPLNTNNVVYRGTDGHVHGLWWTTGPVGHDDLSALAGAPNAAGTPYPYVFPALGTQNVLYRGTDGHVHGLWWTTGPVGNDDLTALSGAPGPAGDPFGYVFDTYGTQNALYRGIDGHLHDLWWSTGAVTNDDLTALSGAPGPASDARAYLAPAYGMQNAVYRGTDGHAHALYWSTGAVGHDDLTGESHAPLPTGNPTAYYVASDASQHVVYRSTEGHLRDLNFTYGAVADDDLTLVTGAPLAAGDPTAYVVTADGTQHVVYRSSDGHLHEIVSR